MDPICLMEHGLAYKQAMVNYAPVEDISGAGNVEESVMLLLLVVWRLRPDNLIQHVHTKDDCVRAP